MANKNVSLREMYNNLKEVNKKSKKIVGLSESLKRSLTDEETKELEALQEEKEKILARIDELIAKLEEDEEVEPTEASENEEVVEEEVVEEEIKSNSKKRNNNINNIDKNKFRSINMNTKKNSGEKVTLGSLIYNRTLGRPFNEVEMDYIEKGRTDFQRSFVQPMGDIIIPSKRGYSVTGTDTGGADVEVEIQDIIQPVWAKQVLKEAGAQFYSSLEGNVQFPIMEQTQTGWAAETAAAGVGDGKIKAVTLSPKRLTSYIDISKQLLIQNKGGNIESYITANLVSAIANTLEKTLLGNDVVSTIKPTGLFKTFTPTTITPTYAEIVGLEAALEGNDVYGKKAWIVNPASKAVLMTTPVDAGSGIFIQNANEIIGYPVLSTSNSTAIAFGDFSRYIIGNWGGVDITVDPYSQAVSGNVRLVVNSYWDAAVLYDAALKGQKAPIVTAEIDE
jgi:HK97 family phage major capsid protein